MDLKKPEKPLNASYTLNVKAALQHAKKKRGIAHEHIEKKLILNNQLEHSAERSSKLKEAVHDTTYKLFDD